jgi:sirohydrochlorin cobaltochelatase
LKRAVILLAHGSRDPDWARPFERIAAQLAKKFLVRVAYLERMPPSLGEAVAALSGGGAKSIRVVPLFLGAGGHVKHDLPRLVRAAAAEHPHVELKLERPIGEQPKVIGAIAEAIAAGTPSPRGSGRRS